MELNREQIVKALECCGRIGEHPHNCGGCPLREALDYKKRVYCRAFLAQYAISLIRGLTEENARLISDGFETVDYAIDKIRKAKADTVRKMQERLNEHVEKIGFPYDDVVVPARWIYQIAKEMLEDNT